MFNITEGDSGPTQVTCPVCGRESDWAESQANMHGACCTAECAAVYDNPLPQMSLFPD